MSVLVNGSPSKEFVMAKGLRQGDPLSLFLFVLVAEGLKGLVSKVVDNGEYVGFNINKACCVDILKFADDTLMVGVGSWKQVWTIKAILRGFEIVSGLGINYHKSKLIDINVSDNFLDIASNFYLVEERKKISFSLAPVKVLNEITRLQSNFLWGETVEGTKIHRASWMNVCLPIEKGGLGLRRIRDFNFSLLHKWRWRILGGLEALWYNVLKARYDDINLHVVFNGLISGCIFIVGLKCVAVEGMGEWVNKFWEWDEFGIPNGNSLAAATAV
ncbi:uncharacterized protein LOC131639202 [Vicia villosa]|uniref:uncharacterized protein LOC131639202 n=1 Tax=Vicia villosa TaxID=3911 RepID=UPI00273B30AE|nr:uncharacterized protein LOC131639202 [Vicia villosa]